MRSADPLTELQQAAANPSLPQALRRALAGADGDGVRLAALLVCKLRFERLIRACAEAEELFVSDPEQFAATFRRYHAAVPPLDFFPPREAQRFRQFLADGAVETSESAQKRQQRAPLPRR